MRRTSSTTLIPTLIPTLISTFSSTFSSTDPEEQHSMSGQFRPRPRSATVAVLAAALAVAALTAAPPSEAAARPATAGSVAVHPATVRTAAVHTAAVTPPLDNGLALTPPMGWNSWNSLGTGVTEQNVVDTINFMSANGMVAAGYNTVTIDDGWSLDHRSGQTTDFVKNQYGAMQLYDANGNPVSGLDGTGNDPPPAT
ncbi:hypothetical protein GXW82_15840 [Streptacidiphilus sp. 4-A2]|nr:hypothetical protein [Streptacidiphilus sp. 4-A2]